MQCRQTSGFIYRSYLNNSRFNSSERKVLHKEMDDSEFSPALQANYCIYKEDTANY